MRRMRGAMKPMVIVLAILVTAAMVLSLAACSAPSQSPTDGSDAEDYVSGDLSVTTWNPGDRPGPVNLSGTTFDGETIDLADWRGDIVLINTWFAACPPCRAEAPDLAQITTEYASQGLRAVGINGTDAAGAAQAFERTFDLPYSSIEDADGSATAALGGVAPLQAVPTTLLLDRDGNIAARILGTADPSTLRTLIDELLDDPA